MMAKLSIAKVELDQIINSYLVKQAIKSLFAESPIEVLRRPGSIIIHLTNENTDKISRIIILPPHGFTSNKIGELSPHPEVRKAKIKIKGGIKNEKIGFNLIKNALKFEYFTVRNVPLLDDEPYPKINKNSEFYKEDIYSSKNNFYVVKENGSGFYHNLVNLTGEWLLLILQKELQLQKNINLELRLNGLRIVDRNIVTEFYEKILLQGDSIFSQEKKLVDKIILLNAKLIIPILIEMLNIFETGKHEPCTIYAVILKIGKQKRAVVNYLKTALEKNEAPKYYLEELIKKLQ